MTLRNLGTQGLKCSSIGLGCMGMSEFYGDADEAQSLHTLAHAAATGTTFWDTADMYGFGHNERLLGRALAQVGRGRITLATKFGVMRGPAGEFLGINGRPEYVRSACEASLQRLGVDHIDLYYQHRVDPDVPIEETVGAMAGLVAEGKVRFLGLSEASGATVRRAHAVFPISALQTEYSLWSRHIEAEHLPICRQLGIGIVPYSPLGRGFLTGAFKTLDDLAANDWRRTNPRFEGENFDKNLALVAHVEQLAAEKKCTPAQIALAWLLSQGEDIVPIPGTRRTHRLDENAASAQVELSPAEAAALSVAIPVAAAAGNRYPDVFLPTLNG